MVWGIIAICQIEMGLRALGLWGDAGPLSPAGLSRPTGRAAAAVFAMSERACRSPGHQVPGSQGAPLVGTPEGARGPAGPASLLAAGWRLWPEYNNCRRLAVDDGLHSC